MSSKEEVSDSVPPDVQSPPSEKVEEEPEALTRSQAFLLVLSLCVSKNDGNAQAVDRES